jgi:hypothetical protein
MEIKMHTDNQLQPTADAIANSIIELVERTDGPVTLARIGREIPGFATGEPPAWDYFVEEAGVEHVIWGSMTEAGKTALRTVMTERRVAVQYVNLLPYLFDGCVLSRENWRPIVLLPRKAANLNTPHWLMRATPGGQEYCTKRAAREGRSDYQVLTPAALRFDADRFAVA